MSQQIIPFVSASAVALDSTGDKWTMTAPMPLNIIQIFARMTVAGTSGSLVLAFDRTPANDGTRVDADLGSLSKAYTSIGVGKVLKKDVSVRVDKGDLIHAEVTTALGTTGDGYVGVLARPAGEASVEYDRATPPVAITVDSD